MGRFGGSAPGSGPLRETWEWAGTAWTQAQPPVSPPARSGNQQARLTLAQRVVLFGDISAVVPTGMWEWDGQR